MENVKVTGVNCSVPNVKIAANDKMNHVESVSLQYEKITAHRRRNIMHSDAWNERPYSITLRGAMPLLFPLQAVRNPVHELPHVALKLSHFPAPRAQA
jgi:hypothetical protein